MSKRAEWSVRDETDLRYLRLRDDLKPEVRDRILRDVCLRAFDSAVAAMLVSGYKYGAVEDAYPEHVKAVSVTAKEAKGKWLDLPSLEKRLQLYRETGNTEYLLDAINFAMIEFMCPRHPKAHYAATDSSGSPGRTIDESAGGGTHQMSNHDLALIATG